MPINRLPRDETNEGPADLDGLFAPTVDPNALPLDDETRRAALLEIHAVLCKHGYDAWFQGGGIAITHKVGPTFVRFQVELLGEHVAGEVEDDDD